jgi:hypothetical protein
MRVFITELSVEQELKNTGMQIDIYSPDGEERLGDLRVTKTKLLWCKGKKHTKNGTEVSWAKFIEWMESQ